jgi:glycosyltransferase involved in cell wall biosynthesis
VGGTETYLGLIIPELARAGHEVSFWHELDRPRGRERIVLPEGVPAFCVEELGERRALAALREWRPDLIYTHSLGSPRFEEETLKIAPAVFFAHAYYGTCVSGAKTFKRPQVTPCGRRFGAGCLLQYYPRRCGGLNPLTMLRLFRLQSKRLELLRKYAAVLTHSSHMRAEYLKHGLEPERVHNFSYYAHASGSPGREEGEGAPFFSEAVAPAGETGRPFYRLLFCGRMEMLKGGLVLLEALPRIRAALGRPVRLTMAGDGPDRRAWERLAAKARAADPALAVEFEGWVGRARLDELYAESDLLVFPSLWPEPFGLAGPEAGLRGVPAAAFDVGGVSEWLIEGVNGHLAPGDPPTADGLVSAVVKCLRDRAAHARLRRGAFETAQRFGLRQHLHELLGLFERTAALKTESTSGGSKRALVTTETSAT